MSETIQELIDYVKEHVDYHRQAAQKLADNPWKSQRHMQTAEKFEKVVSLLTAKEEAQEPIAKPETSPQHSEPKQLRLWLNPDELDGLPPELMQELSTSTTDKTDLTILSIIADRGGIASLDQILVDLFRRLKDTHKRNTLISRLFRMSQRKQIFSVPGKKGVYATTEISEEDAKKLLGDFDLTES